MDSYNRVSAVEALTVMDTKKSVSIGSRNTRGIKVYSNRILTWDTSLYLYDLDFNVIATYPIEVDDAVYLGSDSVLYHSGGVAYIDGVQVGSTGLFTSMSANYTIVMGAGTHTMYNNSDFSVVGTFVTPTDDYQRAIISDGGTLLALINETDLKLYRRIGTSYLPVRTITGSLAQVRVIGDDDYKVVYRSNDSNTLYYDDRDGELIHSVKGPGRAEVSDSFDWVLSFKEDAKILSYDRSGLIHISAAKANMFATNGTSIVYEVDGTEYGLSGKYLMREVVYTLVDSDGDGYSDTGEIAVGSDPLNPDDYPVVDPLEVLALFEAVPAVDSLLGEASMTIGTIAAGYNEVYFDATVDMSGASAGINLTNITEPVYFEIDIAKEDITVILSVIVGLNVSAADLILSSDVAGSYINVGLPLEYCITQLATDPSNPYMMSAELIDSNVRLGYAYDPTTSTLTIYGDVLHEDAYPVDPALDVVLTSPLGTIPVLLLSTMNDAPSGVSIKLITDDASFVAAKPAGFIALGDSSYTTEKFFI